MDHTADFIRVNGVYPAWVNTPMLHTAEAAMPPEIQMAKRMRAMIPSNEIAEPEEVADTMLFLSSPRASYLQGAAISVDGGGMLWPANHHDF